MIAAKAMRAGGWLCVAVLTGALAWRASARPAAAPRAQLAAAAPAAPCPEPVQTRPQNCARLDRCQSTTRTCEDRVAACESQNLDTIRMHRRFHYLPPGPPIRDDFLPALHEILNRFPSVPHELECRGDICRLEFLERELPAEVSQAVHEDTQTDEFRDKFYDRASFRRVVREAGPALSIHFHLVEPE